jgi:type I restriction enzyme M protein
MFEQAFRNIDDILRKEAGCTTELDYTEQTSWLLFLKYLDGLEQDRADEAAQGGKRYTWLLDKPCRWETWAAPKGKDGKLDHNTALTGDDLRDFVNQKLFPYLQGFKQRATGPNTIEYLDPGRNLGKTNPLNDEDIADFIDKQRRFSDSDRSWTLDAKTIDQTTFDLSVKNPDVCGELKHRTPQAIPSPANSNAMKASNAIPMPPNSAESKRVALDGGWCLWWAAKTGGLDRRTGLTGGTAVTGLTEEVECG